MYPVMLDLRGRRCLVVGAGQIAHRKLARLLDEGAAVTVVAPNVIEPIARLAAQGTITLLQRPFAEPDVEDCRLVLVATGDPAVSHQVAEAARARGILVNVADAPDLCDFHLPASVRRGDLQLTVASAGGAPFAVRRLRQLFDRRLGPEWSVWIGAAKRFRQRVQMLGLSAAAADERYDRFFNGTVDVRALTVRVPAADEEAQWAAPRHASDVGPCTQPVIQGPWNACAYVSNPSDDAADGPPRDHTLPRGHVSLVGAGPGAPGLLTVEAMNRLRCADAVVFDRLAIPTLPLDLPDSVELYDVGKEAGHHPLPQDDINALLLRLGRQGKRVVRLKGGDPFVFARGGEEALVLRAAGIPCEIVPGVTAGIAAPAAAGIPVTFRGEALRLTFVTAHEGGAARVRWDLLAQDKHATLVGYMGVSTLADVAAALIAAGMSGDTPAAVIAQGTLANQRSVRAPLAELPALAQTSGIRPPAVFVIGPVVAHADQLECLAPRPLHGARFAMLSPCSRLSQQLRDAGAEVLLPPAPLTTAARLVLGSAPLSGWIVQSRRELDLLDRERAAGHLPPACQLWCLGTPLTVLARTRGWSPVSQLDITSTPPLTVASLLASLEPTKQADTRPQHCPQSDSQTA